MHYQIFLQCREVKLHSWPQDFVNGSQYHGTNEHNNTNIIISEACGM